MSMDIEEGRRRLSKVLTWLVVVLIWIPGNIVFILSTLRSSVDLGEALTGIFKGFVFVLVAGFVIRDILRNAGMWVIKGFVGEEESE